MLLLLLNEIRTDSELTAYHECVLVCVQRKKAMPWTSNGYLIWYALCFRTDSPLYGLVFVPSFVRSVVFSDFFFSLVARKVPYMNSYILVYLVCVPPETNCIRRNALEINSIFKIIILFKAYPFLVCLFVCLNFFLVSLLCRSCSLKLILPSFNFKSIIKRKKGGKKRNVDAKHNRKLHSTRLSCKWCTITATNFGAICQNNCIAKPNLNAALTRALFHYALQTEIYASIIHTHIATHFGPPVIFLAQ